MDKSLRLNAASIRQCKLFQMRLTHAAAFGMLAVLLFLANIPGKFRDGNNGWQWSHGWPWTFLARDATALMDSSAVDPWRLWNGPVEFSWLALAGDLGIAITALGAACAVVRWRLHSKPGRLTFSLRQVLLATTLLACLFGYASHLYRTMLREVDAAGRVNAMSGFYVNYQPCVPDWMWLAVPNQLKGRFQYVDSLRVRNCRSDEKLAAVIAEFPRLRTLECFCCQSGPQTLATIARLSHLQGNRSQVGIA